MAKGTMAKRADISKRTKDIVFERDGGKCIICGKPGMPNSHYIRRSQGGLGIEENVATMCPTCHYIYDHGHGTDREFVTELFADHMRKMYPDWDDMSLVYDRWANFPF